LLPFYFLGASKSEFFAGIAEKRQHFEQSVDLEPIPKVL
jgi:hypothetical protein